MKTILSLLALVILTMAMPAMATLEKYKALEYTYEYDFAVDGGAVSVIPLRNSTPNKIPSACVVEDVQVFVQTAFTSGGSATVTLGNSVDDDGYMATFFSLASANAALRSGQVAGALLWDDTNDAHLSYYIPSDAASIPKIKIGTAALTAGKAKFVFTCRKY